MKKWIVLFLAACMVFAFSACGGGNSSGDAGSSEEKQEVTAEAPQRDLPEGSYEDIGEGTLYIKSASGSTENGDEIIIYPDMDAIPFAYLDYELWDMDGSVQTYIYLDGVEMDKQQVGAGLQSSLFMDQEWMVTEGTHTLEAVQYADNDPANDMTFYRSESFTVKTE